MAGLATFIQSRIFLMVDPGVFPSNFDQLEVWQSPDGVWEYVEITSNVAGPAAFHVAANDRGVDGLTLNLLVNESIAVNVTFNSANPVSSTIQASQISAQGLGLVSASVVDDELVIRTTATGRASTLRVVDGTALALLGLTASEPDAVRLGTGNRVALYEGLKTVVFLDQQGSQNYFYKVRYRNSATQAVSEYSEYFQADMPGGVGPAHLVQAFVQLASLSGAPLANKEVYVHLRSPFTIVDSRLIAGRRLSGLTDETGRVEFTLPRGLNVVVTIVGTDITRDLTVPTDPAVTVIDLLDPTLGSNDVFQVQRPPVDYATRRS